MASLSSLHIFDLMHCAPYAHQRTSEIVTTRVQLDEDSDDEDVVIIEVEKLVLLEGGVTDKHIRATIRLWCGMLLLNQEFFEGPTVDATDGDEPE